jgi:polyhydroxyalkanoate synthesis repressor PhaR
LTQHSISNLSPQVQIIKRYGNRKLYDTKESVYVTLADLSKMVRANEQFIVIENKTKNDITAITLTQVIFENEKKAAEFMPVTTLSDIIKTTGNISKYLLKFGLFTQEQMLKQEKQKATNPFQDFSHTSLGLEFQEETKIPVHVDKPENVLPVGILG